MGKKKTKKKARTKRTGKAARARASGRVYELVVSLIGGPMTEEFAKANPEISRTILIQGDQTLAQLHHAIFDAFDREDEHMYEFQVGGNRPMDPDARRYVLPMAAEYVLDEIDVPAGLVTRTTLDDLGLEVDEPFGYWFDFGDDWWHQVDVAGIQEQAAPGEYPRITLRVGDSPPQYIEWDEEEEQTENGE